MSYQDISTALAARLQAVLPYARVHDTVPYTREPDTSQVFWDLFCDSRATYPQDRPPINTVIFTRTNRRPAQLTDGQGKSVVHEFQVAHLYSHDEANGTNQLFQSQFEAICNDLEDGDRTLGGKVHTHGLPAGQAIGDSEFYGKQVHDARFQLLVEEVIIPTVSPPADPVGGADLWLPCANAFEAWLAPQLGPLGLKTAFKIDRQTGPPHPRLPARPVLDCPKLTGSFYTRATNLTGTKLNRFDIDGALWLYRSQETPGENYQKKVLEGLDFLRNKLDVNGQLPSILRDAGIRLMYVVQDVVHEELQHPLGEPRLRSNPGELQLKIQAQQL